MRTNQLLDQDQIWITADRMPMTLEEMDPEHRRMTLAFLRRRARTLQKGYQFCVIEDALRGHGPEELDAQEIYDAPEAWLERRPLVIALARLVRNDGAIDAEVVTNEIEAAR